MQTEGEGIVVIDDDPLMLAVLEPKLRAMAASDGGKVRAFRAPEAALAWIADGAPPPRLVLSDFNLKASITGLELLRRVSVIRPNATRVLMSGYSREQIGLAADAPVHGFVEKELHVDAMINALEAILKEAHAARAAPARAPATRAAPKGHTDLTSPAIIERFIASTPDLSIITLDPQGIVRTWNLGAERMKGWTASEIVGRDFSVFYPPADVASQKPRYVLRRAAQAGRFEDEGWRVRKDGSQFWGNCLVASVREDAGALLGYVKVTRDVTERRRTEGEIRRSEERYRLFIESVKDYAMFVLDPTGHIMSWNPGAERLKGYRPEEIIGRHFSVFYAPADRERHHPEDELEIALREGRYEEEGWRLRKDGSRFWASVTITALFDEDHRHVGFAKVTRDLTERKQAEERMRMRAESYAELNRELDAFSHSVAHDLRAPVRGIHTLTQALLEDAKTRLTPEDIRTLEAIHEGSKQMATLIKDLLDLSLAARQEPARAPVDMSKLARSVLEEKAAAHPDREVDAQIQEGLAANADERLVRVALGNLFDNAIKFARGSKVRVEFGREASGAFYVRDDGVGFAPEQAGRLFKPFTRLHDATDFPGTGIGLTIVERIVRRHGGRAWAESAQGKGATFRFTLGQ